ncbi:MULTISPECIES: hypothetical protein [Sulfurimonas]|uniref:AMP-activated protein kinase glycogen-binding domain-containing protein n=1 Tax=Sulfurimonas diazotrophicus TaxID=3131939 RepID=A0ABZ3H757_9BACT
MIRKKQNGQKVWVTFTVSPETGMETVALCGAWNGWSDEPMKQKKNGEFYLTKVLPAGSTFEFGYKSGDGAWMAETDCTCVPSPFGSDNALLEL